LGKDESLDIMENDNCCYFSCKYSILVPRCS
jgi:hypothetical protein